MTKEALTLALEALELAGGNLCEALHHPKKLQHGIGEPCPAVAKYDQAITAIKEALSSEAMTSSPNGEAQTEHEPVAWWIPKAEQFCLPSSDGTRPFAKAWEPLYTTPPQRKPLTDEEIGAILEGVNAYGTRLYTFARAIEAAHSIKGDA